MSNVTLFGLGAMGTALAKALIAGGYDLTIWNRSREKMDPIVSLGGIAADNAAEAVQASKLIMVCVSNYAATRTFLDTPEVTPHLARRTLVQLGTGTPAEARENEIWMRQCSGDYLDVTIQPYPERIGEPDSRLFISGSSAAYGLAEPCIQLFGGDLRYLGENVGAANTLDLSELIYCLAKYAGFAHAARICEAEGVGLDQFASLFEEQEPARDLADMVHANNYALGAIHPGASVRVWEGCVQLIQDHARLNRINSEVPDFISSMFNRAIDAGYAEEDVAALVKVLRGNIS